MGNTIFHNPTSGELKLSQVIEEVLKFVKENPRKSYDLIIGTDSKVNGDKDEVEFVTAIVIHRLGNGGRYFWHKIKKNKIYNLHQKIYQEVVLSIEFAQKLLKLLEKKWDNKEANYNLEIHIDVGENGKSRDVIKEVVGMVKGNGFNAQIKPAAYAASHVADKYT